MDHNQQPSFLRNTHSYPSIFSFTVVWIKDGKRLLIFENRCSFVKGHTVFISVFAVFRWVPLEIVIYGHFQYSFGLVVKPNTNTAKTPRLRGVNAAERNEHPSQTCCSVFSGCHVMCSFLLLIAQSRR